MPTCSQGRLAIPQWLAGHFADGQVATPNCQLAIANGLLEATSGGILAILKDLGGDLCKNGRSVKTNNTTTLWVVFWGVGPPLEGPGGCLGSVLGDMLEDVCLKISFFWLSWAAWCQDGAQERQPEAR